MSDIAIKFENISKQYRLGTIGTGTLSHDLKRWWKVNIRGKEDPYLKIGSVNERGSKTDSEYVWALRDINLEVKQGEVLGIIGKNGAGKSTLLKILSRVTSPTTGHILAKGRIASLLEVGTGFHPEMTGRENIFMNGSIMGMTKIEITRKMDEIIDFSGVEKYIDTPVKRYSSGMTVRLGFAIAAHLEPEILVVDEVLAVGDAEFQKKAIGKMQDVSQTHGRTVLFVSHNMDAVLKLTSRCIILHNGRIISSGLTNGTIKNYLNLNKATGLIYENKSFKKAPHISFVGLKTSLPNNIQVNGKSMSIVVELTNYEPVKSACFSFQIIDSNERNFVHQWIFATDQAYCNKRGKYQLECTIPNLKLYMGKYYLKCYFSEPPGGKVFEILENICPFEVVMYETNKSMFSWYPGECAYLEEGYWEIKHKSIIQKRIYF
jgi:lipopolysaccharide transport system ATP-binding protein